LTLSPDHRGRRINGLEGQARMAALLGAGQTPSPGWPAWSRRKASRRLLSSTRPPRRA